MEYTKIDDNTLGATKKIDKKDLLSQKAKLEGDRDGSVLIYNARIAKIGVQLEILER